MHTTWGSCCLPEHQGFFSRRHIKVNYSCYTRNVFKGSKYSQKMKFNVQRKILMYYAVFCEYCVFKLQQIHCNGSPEKYRLHCHWYKFSDTFPGLVVCWHYCCTPKQACPSQCSALAEITLTSPQKLFIFIIKKKNRIEVSNPHKKIEKKFTAPQHTLSWSYASVWEWVGMCECSASARTQSSIVATAKPEIRST